MKRNKKDRPLGLARESLRSLTAGTLEGVRGGVVGGASVKTGECQDPPCPPTQAMLQ